MIEQYQFWQKFFMWAAPICGTFSLFFGIGWNHCGLKIKDLEKQLKPKTETKTTLEKQIEKTTNNIHVQGDYVVGEKTINSSENINAPNALIVTNKQSGGQNIVNYYQNEFKNPNTEIDNLLDINLKKLVSQYPNHPHTIIEIESGNSQRNKVAIQLEKYLEKYNLGIYPKGNTSMGRFPEYPISIFYNSKNKEYVESLINSIKPFLESDYHLEPNNNFSEAHIKIYINGQPLFDNNGMVKIE